MRRAAVPILLIDSEAEISTKTAAYRRTYRTTATRTKGRSCVLVRRSKGDVTSCSGYVDVT